MGARVENGRAFFAPVPGDHIAPRAFQPHDLRPLQLQVFFRRLMDPDFAPQAEELFRQDGTDFIVIPPRRHLGVDGD